MSFLGLVCERTIIILLKKLNFQLFVSTFSKVFLSFFSPGLRELAVQFLLIQLGLGFLSFSPYLTIFSVEKFHGIRSCVYGWRFRNACSLRAMLKAEIDDYYSSEQLIRKPWSEANFARLNEAHREYYFASSNEEYFKSRFEGAKFTEESIYKTRQTLATYTKCTYAVSVVLGLVYFGFKVLVKLSLEKT